jgi:hypothetical protein
VEEPEEEFLPSCPRSFTVKRLTDRNFKEHLVCVLLNVGVRTQEADTCYKVTKERSPARRSPQEIAQDYLMCLVLSSKDSSLGSFSVT